MSQSHITDRRRSVGVDVGGVTVGGDAPIVVQSMTNTDTADIDGTVEQVAALARTGSELVRITVDRDEAAAAVPHIREKLDAQNISVPLIGDFHYIGHKLLNDHPACAEALQKYRINPGNVGFREKRDTQFSSMIETALKYDRPVRIGVNWGSLDQELLTRLMDENAQSPNPKDAREVMHETIVQSALLSAERAEELGMGRDKIILSAKVSNVQDLIQVYRMLAARSDHALHLGLTEAGMGSKCIVASTAGVVGADAGRYRRYDPDLADARTGWRPYSGSDRRPGDPAVHGLPLLHAHGDGMSGLRAYNIDGVSGTCQGHPGPYPHAHAAMARKIRRL